MINITNNADDDAYVDDGDDDNDCNGDGDTFRYMLPTMTMVIQ